MEHPDWTLAAAKTAWREAEVAFSKANGSIKIWWKHLERLGALIEWARQKCHGRTVAGMASAPLEGDVEIALWVANEVCFKYVEVLFKMHADEGEDDRNEDIQMRLRVVVCLVARLSFHPALTRGLDAVSRVLFTGKVFYKKNGVSLVKDDDEDEEEEVDEDPEAEVIQTLSYAQLDEGGYELWARRITLDDDLDLLQQTPEYLNFVEVDEETGVATTSPLISFGGPANDTSLPLHAISQLPEVQQLLRTTRQRLLRYATALDIHKLLHSSPVFSEKYFGARDLLKELKRERRDDRARRKILASQIEANTENMDGGNGGNLEKTLTASSTVSSSQERPLTPSTNASSIASSSSSEFDAPVVSFEDSLLKVENPCDDAVDGEAQRRRLKSRRTASGDDAAPLEEEFVESDGGSIGDMDEDDEEMWAHVHVNDDFNRLFHLGFCSKASQKEFSVYLRKQANFMVRSGMAAILFRRVLKGSILHPSLEAFLPAGEIDTSAANTSGTSSSPAIGAPLYPFFTSSQMAFLNWTCSFKLLCRMLPFLHRSIAYQMISHLVCIYRNIFTPLASSVEGMRQDVFVKELEDIGKAFELKLLKPSMEAPLQLALPGRKEPLAHLKAYSAQIPRGHIERLSACAWDYAASREPILSLYARASTSSSDSNVNGDANKSDALNLNFGSFLPPSNQLPNTLSAEDRASDDFGVELNAIRAISSLESRVLERRLAAVNLLVDASRESTNIINFETDRKRLLEDYQKRYTLYQEEMETYKAETARRMNLANPATQTGSTARLLPLVPPRKPEHPFQQTSHSHMMTVRQQQMEQLLNFNAKTYPFTHALPAFLSHHAFPIINALFGAKAHVALLPKAKDILAFLAQQNMLLPAHLDFIWQSHLSKHISIVHLVWEALGALAPVISLPLLEHLFLLVQRDLSPNMISKEMINLIKTITSVALQLQDASITEEVEKIKDDAEAVKLEKRSVADAKWKAGAKPTASTNAAENVAEGAGAGMDESETSEDELIVHSVATNPDDTILEQELWQIESEMQRQIWVVQNKPRKLYGLWTMMRVITDGDTLASQATPTLIKEIVENFFKMLFDWAPCTPFRLPVLVFLLYRMQQNQSAAQAMLLFTSILETYIPHKQFMQYSPVVREEFAQPPVLSADSIASAQQIVSSTPSRLLDLSSSATKDGLITTQGLTMDLEIPFISQQMAVSSVVNWLESHFDVQLTIIAAMTHYKAIVLQHEAGIPREQFVASVASASVASAASLGSIPSQYVIQSIKNKKLEERRNEGFIPSGNEAQTVLATSNDPVALSAATATTPAAKSASPAPSSSSRYLKLSPFSYWEHIEIRLKAMVAVAHVCEVKKLGRDGLDKWWVLLMRWCLTKKEMKMMSLHWTSLLFNYVTNHFPVLDVDMEYLFDKFAQELDVAEATKTELDLVKAFIVFFAWRRDQYVPLPQRDHQAYPHGFCIRGDISQIPGLHLFWKIATQTKDAKTAEAANTIIVSFYEYPSPDTDKAPFQTAFVMNAVQIIQSNYDEILKRRSNLASPANQSTSKEAVDLFTPISRCLTLVRKVLSSSVNRAAPTTRGAAIKLSLKPLNGSQVDISLYHNDPVSTIRVKAAELMKTPTSDVRLILSGKELKPEFDLLPISQAREPPIPINAMIHVVKKPGMTGQSSNDATSNAFANQQASISVIASLLSTEPYFSLFFNVLLLASSGHKEELAQQVWSLLMDLPHNRELMTGLESISALAIAEEDSIQTTTMEGQVGTPIDWNVLLDPTNSFKLFYSLQIVESLLRPRDGPTEVTERWYEAFKQSGGVLHLVRLLLTAPLTDASQGFKRFPAASLILDLLSTYLQKDNQKALEGNTAPRTTALSNVLGNQPIIPYAALFSLLEDPSIATIGGSKSKSDHQEPSDANAPKMVCLLAQRLLELGLASIIDESDLLHGDDSDHSSLPTSPVPSTQEEQDDANAAAKVAPTVTKQGDENEASNSEILLSQLWPFIISISSHSASMMLASVLSKSMKPLWQKLMQVVFLSKVHLDRVRASLSNAISSLLSVVSGAEYYEVVNPSDGSSLILTSKALIYFSDLALNIFSPSSLPPGLPHCHEFFSLLQTITTHLFQVPSTTVVEHHNTPKFLLQHTYSCRLLQHDPTLAAFAQRLHAAVSATAQALLTYPVIERRGDASLKDVFLIGLFDFIKSCLDNFPSWIFTHPSIVYGGATPRLDDNPNKTLSGIAAAPTSTSSISNSNAMDVDSTSTPNNANTKTSDKPSNHSIVTSIGNLLFRIPNPSNSAGALSPPSCKTSESRSAAFALLVTLTNPQLATYFESLSSSTEGAKLDVNPLLHLNCLASEFILPRHIGRGAIGTGIKSWAYQPLGMEKAACGYVGLRNLAATCYMNSLMQQFYMVPQFRSRVFSLAPFGLPASSVDGSVVKSAGAVGSSESSEKKADALVDSRNVVFQLQNLFAHLQESQQKYYDPTSFTKVYKGPDGRVMNPIVQMDAEEFFAGLLDKIESVIKGTPDEKAIREFFGGTLLQQLEAKDCGHVSKREEDMLTIPVEVKGKANLYESLDAFVKADVLDGDNKYQCSQCNQMVDARKFSCLGRLPDNLVFSLKRFDFDFESLMRVKVNDYFEFPTALSVEPYTAEGMKRREKAEAQKARQNASSAPQEGAPPTEESSNSNDLANIAEDEEASNFDPTDYTYTLSGIVIHRGTADSGHYYSYIKDRNSSPEKPQWYLFNDMSVESFDEAYIPPLAFGGEDDSRRSLKSYSAYMLFYTKNKPSHPLTQAKLDEITLSQTVPRDLFASTWVDNACFLLDQQIYEKQYLEFLGTLVKAGDDLTGNGVIYHAASEMIASATSLTNLRKTHIGEMATVALARLNWTIITETLLQMRVKTWFADHMLTLSNLVRDSPMAAKTIIAELTANTPQAVNTLMKIFVECPVNDLKQQFATLVAEALISCIKQSLVSDESVAITLDGAVSTGEPCLWASVVVPERGEDSPAFDAPYSVHIRHFMDVWMSTILDYSKQDVSNEDRRSSVLSVINAVASVMSLALDNHSSRSVMVSLMLPYVHVIMEIMDKMPGPEDEESKKKLKDWRKAFKPLVSIIATIVTSSSPSAIPPPPFIIDMGLGNTSTGTEASERQTYDEQALALLPIELSGLQASNERSDVATLPMEAWAYLLKPSFLQMLLDDPGLASSVNTHSLNICQWLANNHPAWARHLLYLCLSRMREVGYERYENLVALLPALLSTVRRFRQVAWDAIDDVRSLLVQSLQQKYGKASDAKTISQKQAEDKKWAWILFPGANTPQPANHFLEDYILSNTLAPEELGFALGKEEKILFMTPNFPVSAANALATLIVTPKWTLKNGNGATDDTLTPIERVAILAKTEMLHAAFVQWAAHKAFPALLEAKKALKFASYWSLRCLLDCVESDFAMRSLFQTSLPLFDDFLPHFIIFEKDERVRALAERFYQSIVVSNDVRRRIWRTNSDDSLYDSCISTSVLNSIFLPVPVSIAPRRHLPGEIDPLWEDRDQFKNGVEMVLCTTGVMSLPDSDALESLEATILAYNMLINKAMEDEQSVEKRNLGSSTHVIVSLAEKHVVQMVETLGYVSEEAGLRGMVQKSVEVLTRLWSVLVRILKAVTKADVVSAIDAAREKERLGSHEQLFKYRIVQLLRLMTWVLMTVPHDAKQALQQVCFDECWPTLWMLWKEGVGENFDFNRTALYAFVDVLSHRFSPVLAALAKDPTFMHMNIHVNIEKSVATAIGKFNDRTSSHFFRIILRTVLYLDSEKRKQSGLQGLASIFGDEALAAISKEIAPDANGDLSKPRFTVLSAPESLIDIGVVRNEGNAAEESEEAVENSLLTKLTSMPAWDWAMTWLLIKGYERYPTLAIYLEQLVRLVLRRLSRKEHMVTLTISQMESHHLDLNAFGASRLLLLSTAGMLQPEVFFHQIAEKSNGTPLMSTSAAGLAEMDGTPQVQSFMLYDHADAVNSDGAKVGNYLANPLDASNAFVNPYKTLATSPYLHSMNPESGNASNAHGLTLTDWNVSYAPLHPVSPLVTLELPADHVLARERVTAWMQDLWLLIEQRMVGVSVSLLLSTQNQQNPLSAILNSLISNPSQSPTSMVHRSAIDVLQTLRLALSWILPLQLAIRSPLASDAANDVADSFFNANHGLLGGFHRPLLPIQRIMFEIFKSDETIAKTALDLVKWIGAHQSTHMEGLTTILMDSVVMRDPNSASLVNSNLSETLGLRISFTALVQDVVEALSLVSLLGAPEPNATAAVGTGSSKSPLASLLLTSFITVPHSHLSFIPEALNSDKHDPEVKEGETIVIDPTSPSQAASMAVDEPAAASSNAKSSPIVLMRPIAASYLGFSQSSLALSTAQSVIATPSSSVAMLARATQAALAVLLAALDTLSKGLPAHFAAAPLALAAASILSHSPAAQASSLSQRCQLQLHVQSIQLSHPTLFKQINIVLSKLL